MNITKWTLYPWFEEHGAELIHPDDISRFRQLRPYGKVFAVVGEEGNYIILQFGENSFRVMPDLMSAVSAPAFFFGQTVEISGKTTFGTVVEVCWHHGQQKPFFYLVIGGKRSGKRYWESDLTATI